MFFKDSCVTKLSEYSCVEEATALPGTIFPAYVGTGNTVLSLDASGLQGLNHGVQKSYGAMPKAGDLYVMSHSMVSDIISQDNVHPYGYFTWEMKRNDMIINHENLADFASLWKRKLYLDEGRVITSMVLQESVNFEMDVTAPLGKDCFVIRTRVRAYDRSNQRRNVSEDVMFRIHLHLSTRDGRSTCETAKWENGVLHAGYCGRENYSFRIGASCKAGTVSYEKDCITVSVPMKVTDDGYETVTLFDFSKTGTDEDAVWLLRENLRERREKFASYAGFYGLDEKQTFLYRNTQYLIMSGYEAGKGYPIGSPFMFPWCWRCSTFWDSTFVMDGIMRLGDKESADSFLQFLFRSMSPAGKPFSWMFTYDGSSTIEDEQDIAPLVMCAHAMTAIRHYEYFRDEKMLREYGLPIITRVSNYAAEKLFDRNEEGRWILSVPVSNDVVEEQAAEVNQTFTLVWFLTILKKCAEYEEKFTGKENKRLKDIVTNYYIEQDENEYYHSRGIRAGEHNCASWIVFLLFPTEGMPFVDMELLNKTRQKYSWEELYMDIQGSYQPWTNMMQGCSDMRRGDVEEGWRMFESGVSHTFGLGYFSEIGPMQQTVGLPPYISAYGTFLNYITYLYVGSSIWENKIDLFTNLPAKLKGRELGCSGLKCAGGLTVSAQIHKGYMKSLIEGEQSGVTVTCPIPENVDEKDVIVYVNDVPQKYIISDRRKRFLSFTLDVNAKAEILIK